MKKFVEVVEKTEKQTRYVDSYYGCITKETATEIEGVFVDLDDAEDLLQFLRFEKKLHHIKPWPKSDILATFQRSIVSRKKRLFEMKSQFRIKFIGLEDSLENFKTVFSEKDLKVIELADKEFGL